MANKNYIAELRPHWFFRVNNQKTTSSRAAANSEPNISSNTPTYAPNNAPTIVPASSDLRKDNDLVDEHWLPFSLYDSANLETAFQSLAKQQPDAQNIVQTNGGRYDCDLTRRIRSSIYWKEGIFFLENICNVYVLHFFAELLTLIFTF